MSATVHDLTRPPRTLRSRFFSLNATDDVRLVKAESEQEAVRSLGRRTVGKDGWVLLLHAPSGILVEHYPGFTPYAVLEGLAEGAVAPGVRVEMAKAVCGTPKETLFERIGSVSLADLVCECASGVSSLDVLLCRAGETRLEKGAAAPVQFPSMVEIQRLIKAMEAAAEETLDLSLAEAIEIGEVTDWTGTSLAGREAAIRSAAETIAKGGSNFASRLSDPMLMEARRTMLAVQRWTAEKHGWDQAGKHIPPSGPILPTFDVKDRRMAEHLRSSNGLYVTDHYKNVSVQWSDAARKIVERGRDQGLGRDEIARDLSKWIQVRGGNQAYFNVVASAFIARSESWSTLRSFQQAGIRVAKCFSVLDEKTTEWCRYIDGKLIPVDGSLGLMERIEKLSDPRDIRFTAPWVRERQQRDDKGEKTGQKELFTRGKDGTDTVLAVVERSGYGTADDRGQIRGTFPEAKLIEIGIGPPPYHGSCRTTMGPVYDVGGEVSTAPPVAAPETAPAPAPKEPKARAPRAPKEPKEPKAPTAEPTAEALRKRNIETLTMQQFRTAYGHPADRTLSREKALTDDEVKARLRETEANVKKIEKAMQRASMTGGAYKGNVKPEDLREAYYRHKADKTALNRVLKYRAEYALLQKMSDLSLNPLVPSQVQSNLRSGSAFMTTEGRLYKKTMDEIQKLPAWVRGLSGKVTISRDSYYEDKGYSRRNPLCAAFAADRGARRTDIYLIESKWYQRLVTHEFAHAVGNSVEFPGLFTQMDARRGPNFFHENWKHLVDHFSVAGAFDKGQRVSQYAKTNHKEDWAETFSHYFGTSSEKAGLQARAPERFQAFDRMFKDETSFHSAMWSFMVRDATY